MICNDARGALHEGVRALALAAVLLSLAVVAHAADPAIGLPLSARATSSADAWFDDAALRQRLPLQRGRAGDAAADRPDAGGHRSTPGIFSDVDIVPEVEDGEAVVVIHLDPPSRS